MARVAERPCDTRVDARPTEQALASKLDLPRSDHQAWGLVFRYGTGVPRVPCVCKLINLPGDRSNHVEKSDPRALISSVWHTRGCGYDPTCGRNVVCSALRVGEFRLFRALSVRECGTGVFYYYFYPRAKTRCLCGPAFKIATFSPSRSSGFKIYNGSLTTLLFNFKPLDFTRFLAAAKPCRRENGWGCTRTTVKTHKQNRKRRWMVPS